MSKKRKRDNMSRPAKLGLLPQQSRKPSKTPIEDQQRIPLSEVRENSSFFLEQISLYLPLPPISQLHPLAGICAEHLSPMILTYYMPVKGVVLAYSKVRLSQNPNPELIESANATILAKSIDEYAASHVWVTADFLLFRPQRGCDMEGWVNLQNESHIGLVCWNFFNASIERKRMPHGWKWMNRGNKGSIKDKVTPSTRADAASSQGIEAKAAAHGAQDDTGYFEDESGNRVDGIVHFRIKDMDLSSSMNKEKGIVSIEGTCLSGQEEMRVLQREQGQ